MRSLILVALLVSLAHAQQGVTPEQVEQTDQPSIDLLTDGALISIGLGFSVISELIIRTGEIRPQDPGPTSNLLAIDRHFAEEDQSPTVPSIVSNSGAAVVGLYALGSTLWTGYERGAPSGWVDATLYAESALLNWTIANLAKLAIRRPRPRAYLDERDGKERNTDSALSFYSAHTAITAGVATTASYLAFVRHPDSSLGWWLMGGGTLVVATVAVGRVEGRSHFPTDVIAGALAGVGIGILVPHLHMPAKERTYWVGTSGDGRGLSLGGVF